MPRLIKMCIPHLTWERSEMMVMQDVKKMFRSLGISEFVPKTGRTGSETGSCSFGQVSHHVLINHIFFPEHTVLPEHVHEHIIICFVRKGSAVQTIDGHEYLIQTGEITIIFPGQKHSLAVQDEPLDITEVIIADYQEIKT